MAVPKRTARRFGDVFGCHPPTLGVTGGRASDVELAEYAGSFPFCPGGRVRSSARLSHSGSFVASGRENRMGTPSTC